jgi:transcriptional regulator with XRE-family HTH domain
MTRERPRDEGAEYTARIMDEVKRLRAAKGWSAQRLAEEMTAAGVPWNTDIVVNLEHGRRKSLRVHELLALAWCLDADSPVDLLVPGPDDTAFPVIPRIKMAPAVVRAWCQGRTGPLRKLAEKSPDEIWAIRMEAEATERIAEQVLRLARSGIPGVHRREDGTDGQD